MLAYGLGSILGLAEPLGILQHHGQNTPGLLPRAPPWAPPLDTWFQLRARPRFWKAVEPWSGEALLEEVRGHWCDNSVPLPVCRHRVPLAATGSRCLNSTLTDC